MIIRPTTQNDAESIAHCVDVVARERIYLGATEGFSVKETKSFLHILNENNGCHFIAVKDDVVIGWCDVNPKTPEGLTHVGILGMGVLPGHRGKGIGPKLLGTAIDWSFQRQIRRIGLGVFHNNEPAIKLYEQFGFTCEGRKRSYRILDGITYDLLIYGLLKEEWSSEF